MKIKSGHFRLWIVVSITWVLLSMAIGRIDRSIPNLFIISDADRGAVSIAYDIERSNSSSRWEAETRIRNSPIWAKKARLVEIQYRARERLFNLIWIAFLPIFIVPIVIIAAIKSVGWIKEGFK